MPRTCASCENDVSDERKKNDLNVSPNRRLIVSNALATKNLFVRSLFHSFLFYIIYWNWIRITDYRLFSFCSIDKFKIHSIIFSLVFFFSPSLFHFCALQLNRIVLIHFVTSSLDFRSSFFELKEFYSIFFFMSIVFDSLYFLNMRWQIIIHRMHVHSKWHDLMRQNKETDNERSDG